MPLEQNLDKVVKYIKRKKQAEDQQEPTQTQQNTNLLVS